MSFEFHSTLESFSPSLRLHYRDFFATMASADLSWFVVTTANEAVHEISRGKSSIFPRLPAGSTHAGYGCLLDFMAHGPLILRMRLLSCSCSSGYDFVIPSSRLHLTIQTLGVALGFVGNYAPRGLSPQIDGMPVAPRKSCTGPVQLFSVFGLFFCFRIILLLSLLQRQAPQIPLLPRGASLRSKRPSRRPEAA